MPKVSRNSHTYAYGLISSLYVRIVEFIWSQEEHRNMGAWTFIRPRFENMCGRKISYCGRPVFNF